MFNTPLRVEVQAKGKGGRVNAAVLSSFEYRSKSGQLVQVPAGFVTDFASIPRPFWVVAQPFGAHAKAAVVHDFLYLTQPCDRVAADRLFLEGMQELHVNPIRARLIWAAVRVFGGFVWRKYA